MKVIEPGQDGNIAALRSSFHVHFLFCGGTMDNHYFDHVYELALKAYDENEVPIAAVIVKDGKILASAYNHKEKDQCCTSHAEILAIEKASHLLHNWRLEDCDIYISLDPCPMCASAIKQARIQHVYSALNNSDSSNIELVEKIFETDHTNPSVSFQSNLDSERFKQLLNSFFEKQRNS